MPLNLDQLITYSTISQYQEGGNAEPLIELLRSERKLTPDIRNFIADILDGKIKKRRGRKKDFGKPGHAAIYKMELRGTMGALKAINSHEPKHGFDAYREALEILAERYEMTPDQLDKIIYPRGRKKAEQPK